MFEILLITAALATQAPDATALLKQADQQRLAFLHSTLRVRVNIESSDGAPQSGEFDVYLGNEEQQLVVFRDKRHRGRKVLTSGDKTWLIVPGSKNPIAVTANQRLLGASSFADIARVRLSRDYTGMVRPGIEACGEPAQPCRVVDISATVKSAPYASGTLWIDGSGLLRKAIYQLASGKPAKEITYQYKDSNNGTVLAGLTLIDLLSGGSSAKTTLNYLDHRPTRHPPNTFDPLQQIK